MNIIHEEKAGDLTIRIYQDDNPMSPDETKDDGAFLVHYHRDFDVRRDKTITMDDLRAWYQGKTISQESEYHIFPVSAYIHDGVVLSLDNDPARGFDNDRWDTSHVGAVLCSKKEWNDREKARNYAGGLVTEWNDYLSGNVYGYDIIDDEEESIGSCWGYFGDYDGKEYGALKEARDQAAYFNSIEYVQEHGNKYAVQPK